MESGTRRGPWLPQHVPRGLPDRSGAPLRASGRKQRPRHWTCPPGHRARPMEPRRRTAQSPPETLSGPLRVPSPLPALRRAPPPPRASGAPPESQLPGRPPSSPTAVGLHLPSIAMMCSPWTAPNGQRGRRAGERAEDAPRPPTGEAGPAPQSPGCAAWKEPRARRAGVGRRRGSELRRRGRNGTFRGRRCCRRHVMHPAPTCRPHRASRGDSKQVPSTCTCSRDPPQAH